MKSSISRFTGLKPQALTSALGTLGVETLPQGPHHTAKVVRDLWQGLRALLQYGAQPKPTHTVEALEEACPVMYTPEGRIPCQAVTVLRHDLQRVRMRLDGHSLFIKVGEDLSGEEHKVDLDKPTTASLRGAEAWVRNLISHYTPILWGSSASLEKLREHYTQLPPFFRRWINSDVYPWSLPPHRNQVQRVLPRAARAATRRYRLKGTPEEYWSALFPRALQYSPRLYYPGTGSELRI